MTLMNKNFPEHYPVSCPPDSAEPPDGKREYYRLVHNPLTLEALKSPYELSWPHANHCDGRALSMYKKPQGVHRLIQSYQWARGGQIAGLRPLPEWGRIRVSSPRGSSTHISFWLFERANRHEILNSMNMYHEEES